MTSLDTTLSAAPARVPTAMRFLFALLQRLETGSVELHTPDGAVRRFGPGGAPALHAKAVPAVRLGEERAVMLSAPALRAPVAMPQRVAMPIKSLQHPLSVYDEHLVVDPIEVLA